MNLKEKSLKFMGKLYNGSPAFRKVINIMGLSLGSTTFIMSGNVCPFCGSSVCATTIGAAFIVSLMIGIALFTVTRIKSLFKSIVARAR